MAIQFDPDDFRPLVMEIVQQVLAEVNGRQNEGNSNLPKLLSEAAAADLLGLKQHVLRDARRRGALPFVKLFGRRVRYDRADLIAYIQSCKEATSR